MKFGVSLGSVNPGLWVQVSEEADRLGYESVWVPEHLVIPINAGGSPHAGQDHPPIPATVPVFDAFAVLAHIAGRTTQIRLGINVYNIGLRHPFITARSAATVDVLSGGRMDLGIGASWLREEWQAVGLDFDRRGPRVDEAIDICRRLWSEDVIEHHGEFFNFDPVAFEPKPVQKPIPLQIGGDGPAAMRRAATVGAGWLPMNHPLDQLPDALTKLRHMADKAGRTTPIEVTMGGRPETPEEVDAYARAGVTRVIVSPWQRSSGALDGLRRFAEANDIAGQRSEAAAGH